LDVLELDAAGILGDDRSRVRIPGREHLPGPDRVAVLHRQGRPIGHLVTLALAAIVVGHDHFAAARDDDGLAARVGDVAHARSEAGGAARLALDLARHRGPRGGAADVERAHRELRARLADRLRGDDTDRLADVHQAAAAEVAAVALAAQPV